MAQGAPTWVERLRARLPAFEGRLLRPGDAGYDEARALWNGMIDRRPALLARCAREEDVTAVVRAWAALEDRVPVTVRGGGHHVAGLASVENGLVIDLAGLREVRVDPDRRRAVVQGGATWADVDAATQRYGLATPGGVVSKTGVAGLTLGGGIGWLRRAFGLSCDNLMAATVVTADGDVVRADPQRDPELLWGLRGGGAPGVVTSFEYRLHPVGPEVAFTCALYPLASARAVVRGHEALLAADDGATSTLLTSGFVPEGGAWPAHLRGEPYLGVLGLHAGSPEAGVRAMHPLRELAEPLADLSQTMPYREVQRVLDANYPDGGRYYWSSCHVPALPDALVDRLVAHVRRAPSARSTVDLWRHGGAMDRPPAEGSAYGARGERYLIAYEANWSDAREDAANVAWVREALREATAFDGTAGYANFPGFREEGADHVSAAHRSDAQRFEALRQRLDPHGRFRRQPDADA